MDKTMATNLPVKKDMTITACLDTPKWREAIKQVLPGILGIETMIGVARMTIRNPALACCKPETFIGALLKCAKAGLPPDGRLAHIIPYGNEAVAIFDWKGLVTLAGRNGVTVTAKLVYADDQFEVDEDDGTGATRVIHRIDLRKPRGDIVAVYSRAVNKDGRVDYEFMTAGEVEEVRQNYSRAKDAMAWKKSWGEMAKKTVIRRHSKRWDLDPEIGLLIQSGDDDTADFGQQAIVSAPLFKRQTEKQIEAAKPEPPVEDPIDHIKTLRFMETKANLTDDDVLRFLAEIGSTPEKVPSLDELALQHGEILQMVVDQWDDISKRIAETKKGEAKASPTPPTRPGQAACHL